MNKFAVQALAKQLCKIENSRARKDAVQLILPVIYEYATYKFDAVQFCIDTAAPVLI